MAHQKLRVCINWQYHSYLSELKSLLSSGITRNNFFLLTIFPVWCHPGGSQRSTLVSLSVLVFFITCLFVCLFIYWVETGSLLAQNPFFPSLTSWPLNRQHLPPYYNKVSDVLQVHPIQVHPIQVQRNWAQAGNKLSIHWSTCLQPDTAP